MSLIKEKLPMISLFSGAGGFDLGLESSQLIETRLCVELESSYFKTLELNQRKKFKGVNFLSHAKLLNSSVVDAEAQFEIKKISSSLKNWAMVGGPPCQSFSSIGKMELLEDPRGQLTPFFFDLVKRYRPRFFVFENVPTIGQKSGVELRSSIFRTLESANYHYCHAVVNMADYGCYTKRKRYFIIGDRDNDIKFPCATHSSEGDILTQKWKRSADALIGIADPFIKNDLTHHDPIFHTETVSNRFKALKPGEYDRKRHRSKLDPERPAPTLVAGGNSGYVHHIHWDGRELTSRESAALHGFPLDFIFHGSKLDVAKQIVNSVPIQFGEFIGKFLGTRI